MISSCGMLDANVFHRNWQIMYIFKFGLFDRNLDMWIVIELKSYEFHSSSYCLLNWCSLISEWVFIERDLFIDCSHIFGNFNSFKKTWLFFHQFNIRKIRSYVIRKRNRLPIIRYWPQNQKVYNSCETLRFEYVSRWKCWLMRAPNDMMGFTEGNYGNWVVTQRTSIRLQVYRKSLTFRVFYFP